MKSEQIYSVWKDRKREIETSADFTDRVMNQVRQIEDGRWRHLPDMNGLIELVSAHVLLKAGMVTAGAVIGVIRVVLVVHVLLFV
ncbi:MAG: hypothetical protein JSU70_19315 [Phycisphaerales bacterium]|nr:MAG: hypothetical protein JSU70_19315 [Phycisphaerales bacterium]